MKQTTHNRVLILFTREPIPGKTKTRLLPCYSSEQCMGIHCAMLTDLSNELSKVDADVIVCYTGGEPSFLKEQFSYAADFLEQTGDTLGERMHNAITYAESLSYDQIVLVGSDIPELRSTTIEDAYRKLEENDVVLGPTTDGGYYLVAMKRADRRIFDIDKYGDSSVLEKTMLAATNEGLSVAKTDVYSDIDERQDIVYFRNRAKTDTRIANSETYKFIMDNRLISIIIPVFNEEASIDRLMSQLDKNKDKAEIVFVDGGSTDRTREIIGDRYTIIESPKGRAKQLNVGASRTSGEILFFLHCDSILPDDALLEIRECMRKSEYGCFGVKFPSKNFFMFTNREISNHRAFKRGLPFGDQGIFITRELFDRVGGFLEIPIMEDYEFGKRLKDLGYIPVATKNRIETSIRRYNKGTIGILKTEYEMWRLRRLYRRGVAPEKIAELYKDIR